MGGRFLILAWSALVLTVGQDAAQDANPRAEAENAVHHFVKDGSATHLPLIGLDADADFISMDTASGFFGFGAGPQQGNAGGIRIVSAPVISADQVHVIGEAEDRTRSEGESHHERMYVVVTRKDGAWGVQLIAVMNETDANAVHEARSTIDRFFRAWNDADNDAIHPQINFPHVFLTRDGRASIAKGPEELVTNFAGMREREGWARSEYHGFDVIHADDSKVIAKLTFTRHHSDGAVYSTVPVVWIFTNQNGHWGLQVRMILPPVESGSAKS